MPPQTQTRNRTSRQATQSRSRPKRQPIQEKSREPLELGMSNKQGLRIIPLGGLGEVGANMMLVEQKNQILIIDMGFKMPDENMPGIDYLIPDISYLKGKEKQIVGILITHGHLDHIGAVPYYVGKLGNPPIYAGRFAKALIMKRQEEVPNQPNIRVQEVVNKKKFRIGSFDVDPFYQNHNIADNFGYVITTEAGKIINTSDWKFDDSPVNDPPTDYRRLEQIGKEKILLLMADSTNSESPGHSLSEKVIMGNLDEIFKQANGRVFAATFASLLNRVQQVITLSEKHGRKVALEGYSMRSNVEIAQKLGILKVGKGTILKTKDILKYPEKEITILSTGAQGEERASLMRVANGEHAHLKVQKNDTIIFSSSVIPGNERSIQYLKDQLYRVGANVYHYHMMDIHASGHGSEEEIKQMINLVKPKFLMPIHGQFSMLVHHARLAESIGMKASDIVVAENGSIVNVSKTKIELDNRKVPATHVLVDGLGVGDVGEIVLRDRQNLSQDGMFVIIVVVDHKTGKVKGSPDIISRGFIYLRESKDLLKQVRKHSVEVVNKRSHSGGNTNWSDAREDVKKKVEDFLFTKTERKPMVLPVIIEV